MPGGVIGNIRELGSRVIGSIPVPVTDGGCSLSGKVLDCESKKQGSNPAAHPTMAYSSMEEYCATNAVMKVRIFLSQRNG